MRGALDNLTIRPGQISDLPAINRVLLVLNKDANLMRPTTFVAEIGGEVRGCAAIYRDQVRGFGWLANVAVDAEVRRRGVGRQMIEACHDSAQAQGIREIWLCTMFWNRKLYEKLGYDFVPVAKVPPAVLILRKNKKCLMMRRPIVSTVHGHRTRLLVAPL